jgi:hypothetical protein
MKPKYANDEGIKICAIIKQLPSNTSPIAFLSNVLMYGRVTNQNITNERMMKYAAVNFTIIFVIVFLLI